MLLHCFPCCRLPGGFNYSCLSYCPCAGTCAPQAATRSTRPSASTIHWSGGAQSSRSTLCAPPAAQTTRATTCRWWATTLPAGALLLWACDFGCLPSMALFCLAVVCTAVACAGPCCTPAWLRVACNTCALAGANPAAGLFCHLQAPHLQLHRFGHQPRRGGQPQVRAAAACTPPCCLVCVGRAAAALAPAAGAQACLPAQPSINASPPPTPSLNTDASHANSPSAHPPSTGT